MFKGLRVFGAAILIVLCFQGTCFAELTQTEHVIGGGGGISSNATFTSIACIAHPSPIGFTASANNLNHSGFLHPYNLASSQTDDTDSDGVLDIAELTGTSFSPLRPSSIYAVDSDRDGHSDAEEITAGTDPLNRSSLLRMTDVISISTNVFVAWIGREGLEYEVLAAPTIHALSTNAQVIGTITGGTGNGAWKSVHCEHSYTPTEAKRFYRVQVKQ